MDIYSLSISLPIALTAVGTFIGIMTFLGNRRKQNKEETKEEKEAEARLVRMETMLVNIEKNTNNLNTRVDNHEKWLTKHETRLVILEEKEKSSDSH